MHRLRSISLTLAAVSGMLDEVAGDIRDAQLQPTDEHLLRIGRAMAEIFDIQRAIYAIKPDLKPAWLDESRPSPDNRGLMETMVEAMDLERQKDIAAAISLFEHFLSAATSPLHKEIVENEIARLRKQYEI